MYSKEQIKEIIKNENIIKCSSKSIAYKNEFKLWCVNKYYKEQYSPAMIFKEAWLYNLVPKITLDDCLKRWRKTFNKKWELWFIKESRWRKMLIKNQQKTVPLKTNKEEYIKYLETKNAYLEELQKYFNEDLP